MTKAAGERVARGAGARQLLPHPISAAQELLAELFSSVGEVDDEEEAEDAEKFRSESPGGLVAVFCPLRLFLHTGHVSCCKKRRKR